MTNTASSFNDMINVFFKEKVLEGILDVTEMSESGMGHKIKKKITFEHLLSGYFIYSIFFV